MVLADKQRPSFNNIMAFKITYYIWVRALLICRHHNFYNLKTYFIINYFVIGIGYFWDLALLKLKNNQYQNLNNNNKIYN
jgi:hypothetical protein